MTQSRATFVRFKTMGYFCPFLWVTFVRFFLGQSKNSPHFLSIGHLKRVIFMIFVLSSI